jgi:RHS repeat-associated protein
MLMGLGLDEIFGEITGGGTTSYFTDALGSTVALTDGSGTVTAEFTYEPYGKNTKTGSGDTPFRYTARDDDGTGLYYYRARYYHPGLGRFVAEDPIGVAGGINLYAYVQGNPISYVDPLGLANVTIGPSGSFVPGIGFEIGFGVYINPGLGDDCFDFGVYGSGGVGGGWNIGGGITGGYVPGPSSNSSGTTVNYNVGEGPVLVTVYTDPKNPDPVAAPTGGSISYGFWGWPWAVSASLVRTGTFGVNDLLRWAGFDRCGCK